MPQEVPTMQELVDSNIANIENRLNQTTPPVPKAFNLVIAIALALVQKALYLFGSDRAKQSLAISADEDGLQVLAVQFDVLRKLSEATILVITLPGVDTTVIPATVSFIGDSNGIRYFPDTSYIITGGFATINVTAEDPGVVGNLNNGETLQIDTQIAGAETTATVQSTTNVGADEEQLEAWRSRILSAMRAVNGGSNANDYKRWAEEIGGVDRAFPYSGKPYDPTPPTSFPGDRTVYILATAGDGVPGAPLLAEVRAALNIDPVTGKARNVLGLVNSTLDVEPIARTVFDVEIDTLVVDASIETQVKADITTALTAYFVGIFNWIEGVDVIQDRNDTITTSTVSAIVQDVLDANQGTMADITVEESGGSPFQVRLLNPGELAKLGTVTYI